MYIAICEDNQEHARILKGMIEKWAEREVKKVHIVCYQSAERFLAHMEEIRCDLAFIDIQMEHINGLQLAKWIRKRDETMILVFTTGLSQMAPRGYEVSALRFLVKPLKENEVFKVLAKSSEIMQKKADDFVIVTYDGIMRRLFKSDICYLEADDHFLCFHLNREVLKFRAKMKDYEEGFPEPQFCKCHRSYIVNMSDVIQISKNSVRLTNGDELPVSRNRWETLSKCYLAYYLDK